ncbi:N-acetylmuramoyl-L-alanine amidase [Streptomyces sp. NPDC006540]|uniref:N-acetylmuramoyl-L-alanine amidase n=1 Tax=Streptomyces sp. NPDC006540 TaxID=3155353 RepID=UPI00339E024C
MAMPLTADKMLAALRNEGLDVAEYKSWRTHNRNHKGPWGTVHGIVIHHTAGRNSLDLCYRGTGSLPGPLCHTHLAKDGKATMVGNGRANHAGTFARNAYDAMANERKVHPRPDSAEPVDGNRCTYGIEIENLGDGEDWYPQAQYDAAVRWAAAICRAHGWTAQSVIGHKEGTRRKIDPKGPVGSADGAMWDMDRFRADVQARLDAKPAPAPAPAKLKPVVDLSNVIAAARRDPGLRQGGTTHAADVKLVEAALRKAGYLAAAYASDGSYGTATRTAYAKWQRALGYSGSDADGVPGRASLTKLGAKYGFGVKS